MSPVKKSSLMLEITAVWKGTVLAVEHLEEGQRFRVGSGPEMNLPFCAPGLDDRVPFVLAEVLDGMRRVNLPAKATARYLSPDGQVSDAADLLIPHPTLFGIRVLQLPKGARAKIELGELSLICATVSRAKSSPMRRPRLDRSTARSLGIAAALHAVFALLVFSMPVMADSLTMDRWMTENRWVNVTLTPQTPPTVEVPAIEIGEGPAVDVTTLPQEPAPKNIKVANEPFTVPSGLSAVEKRARGKQLAQEVALAGMGAHLEALTADPLGISASNALASMNGTQQGSSHGFNGVGLAQVGHGRHGPGATTGFNVGVATHGGTGYRPTRKPSRNTHKPKLPPVVVALKPEVSDGLSRVQIQRVVRRMRRQYEACYNKELQTQRDLNGKLTVKFTIGGQGNVLAARIVRANSTMNHAGMERCMVKRIKRWIFPAPKGNGLVKVNYPFIFRPNR